MIRVPRRTIGHIATSVLPPEQVEVMTWLLTQCFGASFTVILATLKLPLASASSDAPLTNGTLPDRWYPVAGFYFLDEVSVGKNITDDIMAFIANYAACGPSS